MAKTQESSENNEKNNLSKVEEPIEESTDSQEKKDLFRNSAILKIGMYAITAVVIVLAIWGVGSLIVHATSLPSESNPTTAPTEATMPADLATPTFSTENEPNGVVRLPEVVATFEPSTASVTQIEERTDFVTYIVQEGDTIFDIADRYGLAPETILWTNWYILGEMPDAIYPGNEVLVPPDDGAMYMWFKGDGLNGVSSYFSVTPKDIINYPLNDLDPDTLGDWALPNIAAGTMLFVPGGTRPNTSWIPARGEEISGNSYLGSGACSGILYGNIGTGTFTWPTTAHYLSGYDYTPPVHNGLDFDGDFGSPIYAADSGVVIYSGWSDRGYGNLVVIDHDGGWQTYYAHLLDGSLPACGANVVKGELIASMGSTGNSTGPHLHFEMRLNGSPVNPWLKLQ